MTSLNPAPEAGTPGTGNRFLQKNRFSATGFGARGPCPISNRWKRLPTLVFFFGQRFNRVGVESLPLQFLEVLRPAAELFPIEFVEGVVFRDGDVFIDKFRLHILPPAVVGSFHLLEFL